MKYSIRLFLWFSVFFIVMAGTGGCGPNKNPGEIDKDSQSNATALEMGTLEQNTNPSKIIEKSRPSATNLVGAMLRANKLGVTSTDLREKDNPNGDGIFVYVPQTRFSGVKRNLIWVVIEGHAFSLNGTSKMVTPDLPWPREASEELWAKTGLDKYMASEAIRIVFD
ncbi:MAG: hypothetical protein ISS76_14825 [Phycisphaerae bacterium]|nr:hypothetical protein [Phycisphaerae bacterium]